MLALLRPERDALDLGHSCYCGGEGRTNGGGGRCGCGSAGSAEETKLRRGAESHCDLSTVVVERRLQHRLELFNVVFDVSVVLTHHGISLSDLCAFSVSVWS